MSTHAYLMQRIAEHRIILECARSVRPDDRSSGRPVIRSSGRIRDPLQKGDIWNLDSISKHVVRLRTLR